MITSNNLWHQTVTRLSAREVKTEDNIREGNAKTTKTVQATQLFDLFVTCFVLLTKKQILSDYKRNRD